MNLLYISGKYLMHRPLQTFLQVLLLSVGIAMISLLQIGSQQLKSGLSRQIQGVDMVLGAKGSPLQLILSSVFHIDNPTGNLPLLAADSLVHNRLVESAVPLALGDNYRGFRIVGTTPEFLNWYEAVMASGNFWQQPNQVIIGAQVAMELQLKPGDSFISMHGLENTRMEHDIHPLTVTGILEPTGLVIDRLILTQVQTIWALHEKHAENHPSPLREPARGVLGLPLYPDKEITAVLIKFSGSMAMIRLPRYINDNTPYLAALPALETSRLFSLLGEGIYALRILAIAITGLAFLSIFVSLYTSLSSRKYDLAMMRTLGASRWRVFMLLLLEGSILSMAGGVLGIFIAQLVIWIFSATYPYTATLGLAPFQFSYFELIIVILAFLLGMLSALLPAWQAYRADISTILSRGE
jgi:putative ABC transport system permease protein